MKIAIIGGSFDPIHMGHIQMGYRAIESLGVEEVWYMPTKDTPLKDRVLTSELHRTKMIELACKDIPNFKVCTLELERNQKSYTIDSLRELRKRYNHDFYWIIGNDQLMQFDKWKDPEELLKLATFVCFDRDGQFFDSPYPIQKNYMDPVPASSSEIRVGNKLNYLDRFVLDYIYAHRLYIADFVKTRVNEHRYRHSLSVASLCEKLAQCNGLDENKAYLIGLFHDIAKSMSKEKMQPWMEILCPENMGYPVPVWHGFVAYLILERIFFIQDETFKQAVYHHVLGTSEDPYAMIVFCADKLDPLREYDSTKQIELCCQDLKEGFMQVKKENEEYLRKENKSGL